jgi:hypothetical protein
MIDSRSTTTRPSWCHGTRAPDGRPWARNNRTRERNDHMCLPVCFFSEPQQDYERVFGVACRQRDGDMRALIAESENARSSD